MTDLLYRLGVVAFCATPVAVAYTLPGPNPYLHLWLPASYLLLAVYGNLLRVSGVKGWIERQSLTRAVMCEAWLPTLVMVPTVLGLAHHDDPPVLASLCLVTFATLVGLLFVVIKPIVRLDRDVKLAHGESEDPAL